MSWGKKLVVALAAMTTIGTGTAVTAQQADAAPLPQIVMNGDYATAVGNHSYCRGAVAIRFSAPPRKRGFIRITVTSQGFTGQGASWKRNPRCRIALGRTFLTSAPSMAPYTMTFGSRRGEKNVRDFFAGSGPGTASVSPLAPGTQVALTGSVGSYVLVP